MAGALGDRHGVASALVNLAEVARDQGDDERARTLCMESFTLYRALGDRWGMVGAVTLLGDVARDLGQYGDACAHYQESLDWQDGLGDTSRVAACLEGMAGVALAEGHREQAAQLLGATEALRTTDAHTVPLAPPDRARRDALIAATRATLGHDHFAAAWAAGQALSVDCSILHARRVAATVVANRPRP